MQQVHSDNLIIREMPLNPMMQLRQTLSRLSDSNHSEISLIWTIGGRGCLS